MDTDEHGEPSHQDLIRRLEGLAITAITATARDENGTEATLITWHRRLGHPSFKAVVALAQNGASGMVITDIPERIPGLDACAACVEAKSVRLPHKEGRARAKEYLGRVHIDIAGPMSIRSAGGRKYVFVVVDDYTRAVYTRPLRHKSEAADAFRGFKSVAESESQKKLREVMTRDASEVSTGEVRDICEQEGIKFKTMIPCHPASNGVAGSTIDVLTNAVRAMLHDSGLPKALWAEAFSTATYVHNRTPTKASDGRTPYEVVYGVKPDVAHLRAFGAPCAIVKRKKRSRKRGDQANMYFFVGYKYGGGGYRVWDPKTQNVLESSGVTFFEDGLLSPTLNESTTIDDADEPVVQPPPKSRVEPPLLVARAPAPSPALVLMIPTAMFEPTPTPHPRRVIRLPVRSREDDESDDPGFSDEFDDAVTAPLRTRHDVQYVTDYLARSSRSDFKCDGGRASSSGLESDSGGGSSAMLTADDADYPPISFSAGIPGGIPLSRLPDPRNVREAMVAPDADGWRDAMDKEMANLKSRGVYELVPRMPGMRTSRLDWALHRKFKNGTFKKHKALLVSRGNHQLSGVDSNESFSSGMRLKSLRALLAVAAIRDFEIMQFGVTSAYLHETPKGELYAEQPDGYTVLGKEDWVWRLKKGLNGFVQAGRTWNEELNIHMESEGFTATPMDPAVYVKSSWNREDFAAGGFWVDDFVGIGPRKELDALEKSVDAGYGIAGLGEVKWVLGVKIERDRAARTVSISQEASINSMLDRFNLADATALSTPLASSRQLSSADCPTSQDEKDEMATRPYKELVGSLAWVALGTRPDIAFATGLLARFNHNPGRAHWKAAKRVLRYLKGTRGWRLTLGGGPPQITGFTDADWGSNLDNRHSIGGYIIKIGSGAVSWKSEEQSCVALSPTEAKYVALYHAAKESAWMIDFLKSLGISIHDAMAINADNQGCISFAKNPVFRDHLKHIDLQYHLTRDLIKEKGISLNYLPTREMVASTLTRALPRAQHEYLAKRIGLS